MKKTTKKPVKKTVGDYSAALKVFGRTYTSTGGTILEALLNLKPDGRVLSVCTLTVSRGDRHKDRVLAPRQAARLFSPSTMIREMNANNISLMFDV